MSVCGITAKGNPEQTELIRILMDNQHPIVAVTGAAGTGKNLISLACALQQVYVDRKYDKIIYARDVYQVGESVGFLPGDINEKIDPFMGALWDNLDVIARHSGYNAQDMRSKIEVVPVFSLRGRSFDSKILIFDEAQNSDVNTLRTVLTRMGDFSKVIFLGSYNQVDNKAMNRRKTDLEKVIEKLEPLEIFANVELKKSMRSKWCAEVDRLLGEIDG